MTTYDLGTNIYRNSESNSNGDYSGESPSKQYAKSPSPVGDVSRAIEYLRNVSEGLVEKVTEAYRGVIRKRSNTFDPVPVFSTTSIYSR